MDKKIAARDDWKTYEMPESHSVFTLDRHFSRQQMEMLRRGNIPQEMEDKWFWYMEGDCLYAYRSWTGFCIYIIQFKPDGRHVVTVNRNPEQYGCCSDENDMELINHLLDWWGEEPYDHYGEWLSETASALKQSNENE